VFALSGSEPRPRPLVRAFAEARADGVVDDVAARGAEVALAAHDPGGVAFAEEMAAATVTAIERLGIDAVQSVHPVGETPELRADDQVVVVRHQAEGVAAPVVALDLVRQEGQEEAALVAWP
jgi:hypothetical protein